MEGKPNNQAGDLPKNSSEAWDNESFSDYSGWDQASDREVMGDDPLHFDSQRSTRRSPNPTPTPSKQNRRPPTTPNTSRRRQALDSKPGIPYSHELTSNLNLATDETYFDTRSPDPPDWNQAGPGRRVGYEEFTAIDWIYEYAKERQRFRVLLSNAAGLVGYLRRAVDASQIWFVLVLTGILTGLLAAFIDIASDWLGDLKTGFCTTGEGGGKFYLNKIFCCWGFDKYSQCTDWWSWSRAVHVSGPGGAWTVGYSFFVGFSVLFALCASLLVKFFAIDAKQSGIPEMKTVLGGLVMGRFLSPWVLVVKCLGLCLTVASGLWLGKEGPLVHVACCCSNFFLRFFPVLNNNEARKREVFSAAASAGISVAFGAPVGGVLFSLEQLSYYFPDKTMWQSFVCAMIAAVALKLSNPFRTGKLVLYQVTYSTGWHAFELVPFALLGVMGGLYGAFFIRLNMRVAKFRKQARLFPGPVLEVIIVALVTALINYPNKFMRAQPTELVATLFAECSDLSNEHLGLCGAAPSPTVIANLISAAILGFLLASITFGLHIPAGIILPSMAIGALLGRAVGLVARVWQYNYPNALIFAACEPDVKCVTPGTYAIVGAASALGGATRMTVSVVVIMFELTGALTYVLPIMVSVLISKWVGDAFDTRGIYESWITFNGYPFLDANRAENIRHTVTPWKPDVAEDTPIGSLMTVLDELVVVPATGHTIASLSSLLFEQPYRGYPVISKPQNPILLGYISRVELSYALSSARKRGLQESTSAFFSHQPFADPNSLLDLRPWMDQTPITLSSRATLQLTTDLFLRLGLRYLLFVDRGHLKGMLTKKDVWIILESGDSFPIGGVADGRDSWSEREGGEGEGEDSGLLRGDDDDREIVEDRSSVRVG